MLQALAKSVLNTSLLTSFPGNEGHRTGRMNYGKQLQVLRNAGCQIPEAHLFSSFLVDAGDADLAFLRQYPGLSFGQLNDGRVIVTGSILTLNQLMQSYPLKVFCRTVEAEFRLDEVRLSK